MKAIMKIPNKKELQQIAFNHSSDIDFQEFMNLYKKCTEKPNSFLVIDSVSPLYEGRGLALNAFRNRIFPIKEKKLKKTKNINT